MAIKVSVVPDSIPGHLQSHRRHEAVHVTQECCARVVVTVTDPCPP